MTSHIDTILNYMKCIVTEYRTLNVNEHYNTMYLQRAISLNITGRKLRW